MNIHGKILFNMNGTSIGKYNYNCNDNDSNYSQLFDNIIFYLSEYLNYFNFSDFKNLILKLDNSRIILLGKKIYNLQKNLDNSSNNTFKRKLRNFLKLVLATLQNGIYIYRQLNDATRSLKTAEKKSQILDDVDLLREYITNLNAEFDLLGGIEINAVKATIKEEYQIYIDRYGFPNNGIFDTDILLNIIEEIENCKNYERIILK